MANFTVIKQLIKGTIEATIKEFEIQVQEYLNNGWKLVNCIMEARYFLAFMVKE